MNNDPTKPLAELEPRNSKLTGFALEEQKKNINRNGRPPKGWTWNDLLEEAMDEKDETGVPAKKIIIKKLVGLAKKSDLAAIKEIIDRMDGKSKESVELNASIIFPHVSIDTKPEEDE